MLELATKVLGQIKIRDESIIAFPEGILGFHEHRKFALLDHRSSAYFLWLQSLHDSNLAFIMVNPCELFQVNYEHAFANEELSSLQLNEKGAKCQYYVILTIPKNSANEMTANLQGPIVINTVKRIGKQCISNQPEHMLHFPVLKHLGKKQC